MNTLYTKQEGHWEESLGDYAKTPGGVVYVVPTGAVATTTLAGGYEPEMAFDPAVSLTGPGEGASWNANTNVVINQKLNAAYDQPRILKRLVVNNLLGNNYTTTEFGIKDVILYGTDVEAAYLNTTYANLGDLTVLHTFQLREHVASNVADPEEVALPVITQAFKYYVFRIANNWGSTAYLGVRQIDMYFEKEPWQPSQQNYIKLAGKWQ